jgi:hypothetical protein
MVSNRCMEETRREILRKVAGGELSPAEAAEALEDLTRPAAPPSSTLRRLRVRATMGSITVLGDRSVAEAVATGDHQARRDGDSLVIETSSSMLGERTFRFGPFAIRGERVVIRANPELELSIEAEAGSVTVEGMAAAISGTVQAGSVRINGFRAPIDLDVQAGSVQARGRLDRGESSIRCQAGGVRVALEPGSSVRIRARTSLGKVSLPGGINAVGASGMPEAVVGGGAGSLQVEAELGSVVVTED